MHMGDTLYVLTYHETGHISILTTVLDAKIQQGYAVAFEAHGRSICKMHIRRVAGSAMVRFYYYANGSVSKAQFTSHPGGGIQRTDITTWFDREGNVTRVMDLSDDGYGSRPWIFSP